MVIVFGVGCYYVDITSPQIAVGLENLLYQINWIFAICGEVNFNRYLAVLLLAR
ncbi:hypothetical protein E5S67_05018 [Microcoleus sp. IPMA8]|uniref:Uncharacterized protein n=1 Tax=Microcoleus asticus IPMA8 TaxID=2563858 RepID=A0ABX2D3Q5_9CYAN|nr:hypothetical protein [Microcoleus asticus IPMA8]